MDVLADIVKSLELRSQLYFRAELTAPFAVQVPEDRKRIRFHLTGRGRSWIGLPTGESAVFETGDLVLVPHGSAHIIASESELAGNAPLLDDVLTESPTQDGVLSTGGGGAPTSMVCGHFEFDETVVHPLLASLPALLHLKAIEGASFSWVPTLLEAVEAEARMDAPANAEVAQRLSEILFIQVLRAALQQPHESIGLLGLVDDPRLGRALRSIHENPGEDWSLDTLAAKAGTSRSVFSELFKARIGVTPMRYLTDWRMRQARTLLENGTQSVSEIGRCVGYASEAAFNRAFRESIGDAPGRYRRTFQ